MESYEFRTLSVTVNGLGQLAEELDAAPPFFTDKDFENMTAHPIDLSVSEHLQQFWAAKCSELLGASSSKYAEWEVGLSPGGPSAPLFGRVFGRPKNCHAPRVSGILILERQNETAGPGVSAIIDLFPRLRRQSNVFREAPPDL